MGVEGVSGPGSLVLGHSPFKWRVRVSRLDSWLMKMDSPVVVLIDERI